MRGSDSAANGALILAIRDQARSHSDFVALCGSKLAREVSIGSKLPPTI